MKTTLWILPVAALLAASAALAGSPNPGDCLTLTCFYDIPDESAPHKAVVEVENSCPGLELHGTLEITKICNPSDPCVEETTTDPQWSIGPAIETQTTVMDCTEEECCSRRRSAPYGPWVLPTDFSATLTVAGGSYQGIPFAAFQPVELACSQSGDRTNTNRCPREDP